MSPTLAGAHNLNFNFTLNSCQIYTWEGVPYTGCNLTNDSRSIPFTVLPSTSISALDGISPSDPLPYNATTSITWNSSGISSGTIIFNGQETPWQAPYYVPITTYIEHPEVGHYEEDSFGFQFWVVDSPAWTETVITYEYIPNTSGVNSSPILQPGQNTFTFLGYDGTSDIPIASSVLNIYVTEPLEIDFSTNPTSITVGSSTLVSWDSPSADYCEVSESVGGPIWKTGISNNGVLSTPLFSDTVFSITCGTDSGYEASKTSAVSVFTTDSDDLPLEAVEALCTILNGPSTAIVNRQMTWIINIPDTGAIISNTEWLGSDINQTTDGTSLSKIYTTIGAKYISATTTGTLEGVPYTASCFATTTVWASPAQVKEI